MYAIRAEIQKYKFSVSLVRLDYSIGKLEKKKTIMLAFVPRRQQSNFNKKILWNIFIYKFIHAFRSKMMTSNK